MRYQFLMRMEISIWFSHDQIFHKALQEFFLERRFLIKKESLNILYPKVIVIEIGHVIWYMPSFIKMLYDEIAMT